MIYDLSQPLYHDCPQFPGQPATVVKDALRASVDGATVERLELMTHSGTHIDAPCHFFPGAEAQGDLPLSHFFGAAIALDLRPLKPGHGITGSDLRRYEGLVRRDDIVLLKTGWGDQRGNTKEFLTEWPYLTGDGAEFLLQREVKGVGIEGLSLGGYRDPGKERDAHLALLSRKKLIVEELRIPEAMLDGRHRNFAALPVFIPRAGGGWTRAIAWDPGDLDCVTRDKEERS